MAFHEVQWYDRKPVTRTLQYVGNNIAPHVGTTRKSYTVPPDKMAALELAMVFLRRRTAGVASGLAEASVECVPLGGSTTLLVYAAFNNNDVDTHESQAVGECGILQPGDILRLVTQDITNGGAMDYRLSCKITEFDAYLYVNPQKTVPEPIGEDVQAARVRPDPEM